MTRAGFGATTLRGFTQTQLQSTASYQSKNLRSIGLESNDLTGWDFSEQDLTAADLGASTLTSANLSGTNLTAASLDSSTLTNTNLSGANLKNAFLENAGSIHSATFDSTTVYNQWTIFPLGFDPLDHGLPLLPSPPGDFDADGALGGDDLATLGVKIRGYGIPAWWLPLEMFDLNEDGAIDQQDLRVWVIDLKKTHFGDADLNGTVDFPDFLALADHFGQLGDWSEGDFDASGDVQFADFLVLAENFGKSSSPVAPVPEPTALWWSISFVPLFARRLRHQPNAL